MVDGQLGGLVGCGGSLGEGHGDAIGTVEV